MATSLFDRVAGIVEEIGAEKKAAWAEKRAGSKDMGNSSHASESVTDDDEQEPSEGAQSADNERIVSETIPNNVVEMDDVSADGAPKYEDVALTQGVESGPTGTDVETPTKGKPEGDVRVGNRGGTTHPADGSYGEKYSSARVANMPAKTLLKTAAELGNDVMADFANGFYSTQAPRGDANAAAVAGQKTAAAAGAVANEVDTLAANIVTEIVKSAYHQADLVAASIHANLRALKQADDEAADPTGGAADGEDHGSEGAAPGGDEAGLMAAMGGGAPGGEEMGGEEMGGAGLDPQMIEQLIQALQQDPQLAAQLEQILQGAGGAPEGAAPGGDMGGAPPEGAPGAEPPPELGAMSDKQAMQQLAMAVAESDVDLKKLASVNANGAKIAAAVADYKRSGKFEFTEAKRGSAERKVRDFMKGYVRELYSRSRR